MSRPSKGNAAVLCGFHGTISSHASGQSSRKIQGKSQSKGGQKGTPRRCLGIMIYIYIMEYCVPIFTHARLGWLDALLPPVLTWKETLKISRCCLLHPKKCFFWQRGFAFDIDQFRCCKCGNTILVVWGCRSTMFDATHGRIKSAIASNSLLSSNQERLKTYRVIRTLCKHGTWRAPLIGTR